MRVLCLAVVIACGAPKQPAPTNDLDLPPQRTSTTEVAADAREPSPSVDASVDASLDAQVSAADPACVDDPAAKRACESMGDNFAPRMVTPCHRGPEPMKPVPRCMCVDVTKPRDCPPRN